MDELTPDQIKELQAKAAKAEKLEADNKELAAKAEKLSKENKQIKKDAADEKAKTAPVSFEVEEDKENEIEGGEYDFTAPSLTWDDNQVYDIRQLSQSKEKKDMDLYTTICAELVKRKSGLVALRKED